MADGINIKYEKELIAELAEYYYKIIETSCYDHANERQLEADYVFEIFFKEFNKLTQQYRE